MCDCDFSFDFKVSSQSVLDLKLSCSTDGNTTVSRSTSHHWFYARKFVSKFVFSNLAEVNDLTEQINKDWFILYRISFGKVQLQATGELVVSHRIVWSVLFLWKNLQVGWGEEEKYWDNCQSCFRCQWQIKRSIWSIFNVESKSWHPNCLIMT